jgi:hypothetical protein
MAKMRSIVLLNGMKMPTSPVITRRHMSGSGCNINKGGIRKAMRPPNKKGPIPEKSYYEVSEDGPGLHSGGPS